MPLTIEAGSPATRVVTLLFDSAAANANASSNDAGLELLAQPASAPAPAGSALGALELERGGLGGSARVQLPAGGSWARVYLPMKVELRRGASGSSAPREVSLRLSALPWVVGGASLRGPDGLRSVEAVADAVVRRAAVRLQGFPVRRGSSGLLKVDDSADAALRKHQWNVTLPGDAVPGTARIALRAFLVPRGAAH